MRTSRWTGWPLVLAGALSFALLPARPGHADETTGVKPWRGTFTVEGTVIAAGEGTLVVDVPRAGGKLRVGATVPQDVRFMVGSRRITLQDLRPGQRIRLVVHRVPEGDEAVSGEVLVRVHPNEPQS